MYHSSKIIVDPVLGFYVPARDVSPW